MKKILLIILLLITSINVKADDYPIGDVDGNSKVEARDYILIRNHLFETKTLIDDDLKRADVNQDGEIDPTDYILIKNHILDGKEIPIVKPVIIDYTINYFGNGETSGSVSSHTCTIGGSCAIKINSFTKTGYNFLGWTTNSDGTDDGYNWTNWNGTWNYSNGQFGINDYTLNLYAMWKENPVYTINYYGNGATSGSVASHTCTTGGSCAIKANGFTKAGYNYLGWTTNSTGAADSYNWTNWSGTWNYTNGQNGINNYTLNLYARWEEEKKYVLPDEYKIPSGYSVVSGKSFSSDTLKYKTIQRQVDGFNNYYALIWVSDANKQINSANNNYNGGQRTALLNKEISTMSYQSKGLIGVNGSYTINGRSNTPAIATKGNIITNDKYMTKLSDGRSVVYGMLTIGNDNLLKNKTFSDVTGARNWLTSVGARNSWAITFYEDTNWSGANESADRRTAICQVDTNNFVLYTGYTGIRNMMRDLHNLFSCKIVANLDGGGSTGMYYKTRSMGNVGIVYEYKRPNECCRSIADMLYFVE